MSDPMAKWTPTPDWTRARLERPGWSAAPVLGLFQMRLSGDLAAAPNPVGFWGIASPQRAAVRIGRDRALLVSTTPLDIAPGWRDGFAASEASDAFGVLELAGAELRALVAEATAVDPEAGSPSAAILFAGVPALLYRVAEDRARLHVEAPLAPYLWRWLETR